MQAKLRDQPGKNRSRVVPSDRGNDAGMGQLLPQVFEERKRAGDLTDSADEVCAVGDGVIAQGVWLGQGAGRPPVSGSIKVRRTAALGDRSTVRASVNLAAKAYYNNLWV